GVRRRRAGGGRAEGGHRADDGGLAQVGRARQRGHLQDEQRDDEAPDGGRERRGLDLRLHRLSAGQVLHEPSLGARRAPSAVTTCSASSAGIAAAIRSGVSCARTAWATASASTSTGAPTRSATLLSSASTWPLVSAAMRE